MLRAVPLREARPATETAEPLDPSAAASGPIVTSGVDTHPVEPPPGHVGDVVPEADHEPAPAAPQHVVHGVSVPIVTAGV